MLIYVDSSFLLSILFGEEDGEISKEIWKRYDFRVSSILLEAECLVTLRRFYHNNKKNLEKNWLDWKEKELYELLEEVNTRILDEEIIEYIRLKQELSTCRTLDAIHLATGSEFKNNISADIKICTYDDRMRKTAKKMDFTVLPIDS